MSENILSKNYSGGLYGLHKFNKYDLFIRKNLGLYAAQWIIKESLPQLHRQIANKYSLEKMALLEPFQVLLQEEIIPEMDSYFILYHPIEELSNQNKANLSAIDRNLNEVNSGFIQVLKDKSKNP